MWYWAGRSACSVRASRRTTRIRVTSRYSSRSASSRGRLRVPDGIAHRFKDSPALCAIANRFAGLEHPPAGPLITRFAPSPTGELHLGHVAHALWLWGVADVLGAKVLVRMEDHDRSRCRPEYERSILDDLAWLGFAPDAVSLASLARHPSDFRQSDTPEIYEAAFEQLRRSTEVYGCTCTRSRMDTPDVVMASDGIPGHAAGSRSSWKGST